MREVRQQRPRLQVGKPGELSHTLLDAGLVLLVCNELLELLLVLDAESV